MMKTGEEDLGYPVFMVIAYPANRNKKGKRVRSVLHFNLMSDSGLGDIDEKKRIPTESVEMGGITVNRETVQVDKENKKLKPRVCVMGRSLGSAPAIELCVRFPEISCCILEIKKSCCPEQTDNNCSSDTELIQFDFETIVESIEHNTSLLNAFYVNSYVSNYFTFNYNVNNYKSGIPPPKLLKPILSKIQSYLL